MSISDDTHLADPRDDRPGVPAVHRFGRPPGALRLRLVAGTFAAATVASLAVWALVDHVAALGVLAVVMALAAGMWVAWCGQPGSVVRVEYAALVVTGRDREERVDVAGADLRVDGAPGHRGWRAEFRRPGRPAIVVDATMVDPHEFTRVLAHWRPDLLLPDPHGDAPDAR